MASLRRIVVLIIWKSYTREICVGSYSYILTQFPAVECVLFPLYTQISNVPSGHLLQKFNVKMQALESWWGCNSNNIGEMCFPRIAQYGKCHCANWMSIFDILRCLFCTVSTTRGYCPQCWNNTQRHDDDSISFPCLQAVNT